MKRVFVLVECEDVPGMCSELETRWIDTDSTTAAAEEVAAVWREQMWARKVIVSAYGEDGQPADVIEIEGGQ